MYGILVTPTQGSSTRSPESTKDANQRGVHPAPPELKFIWEKSSNLDLRLVMPSGQLSSELSAESGLGNNICMLAYV